MLHTSKQFALRKFDCIINFSLQGTHQTYSSLCKRLIVVTPRAAHMNKQQIRACSSLTQLHCSLVPSVDALRKWDEFAGRYEVIFIDTQAKGEGLYCNSTEMGFSIQKLDHVGLLSLAAGAVSINLSFKKKNTPVRLLKRSRNNKNSTQHAVSFS